ncbi:hypothetical protein HS961_00235 [Comamonas piscis]|uniref:Uncharacterized protein n=1 Tax=Comamonas piscis TaxID=1562974 RepID=A0A7G5EBL5_9BURK|nr:hypothetical protein [Comamonas piscis]QMV71390.1 hypothetical protein HS961_00235 [Comamonas piscis]WSO34097.1 hypothetical protein VUJ63_00235 [Comamonas piscis]
MTADSHSPHLDAGKQFVAEAQKIATTDFAAARALWQQAGQAFYRAHQADRNQPEAAMRLAQAWMAEAHALHKEGSPNATVMWQNAAAQNELAFDLDPRNARLAMAAASCHHYAGDAEAAEAWMQIGQHLASGGDQTQESGDQTPD